MNKYVVRLLDHHPYKTIVMAHVYLNKTKAIDRHPLKIDDLILFTGIRAPGIYKISAHDEKTFRFHRIDDQKEGTKAYVTQGGYAGAIVEFVGDTWEYRGCYYGSLEGIPEELKKGTQNKKNTSGTLVIGKDFKP